MERPAKRRRLSKPREGGEEQIETSRALRRSPFHSWNKTGGKQALYLHRRHSKHFGVSRSGVDESDYNERDDSDASASLEERDDTPDQASPASSDPQPDEVGVGAGLSIAVQGTPSATSQISPSSNYRPTTGSTPPFGLVGAVVSAANIQASNIGLTASVHVQISSNGTASATPTAAPSAGSANSTSSSTTQSYNSTTTHTQTAPGGIVTPLAISSSTGPLSFRTSNGSPTTLGTMSDASSLSVASSDETSLQTAGTDSTLFAPGATTATSRFDGTGTMASGAAGATSSLGALSDKGSGGPNVPTPTVVGSVVGGVAGLTFVILFALFGLRWYKKRQRAQVQRALGPGIDASGYDDGDRSSPLSPGRYQPMAGSGAGVGAEAGLTVGAAAGLMQRLARNRQTQTPEMQDRSFERLSGRKLPSQFSPGMQGRRGDIYPPMTSDPVSEDPFSNPPAPENPFEDPSDRYAPFVPGASLRRQPSEEERMMPSPARTPTIQQSSFTRASHLDAPLPGMAGRWVPSPPPQDGARASAGRTPPLDGGNRGSRFREEV